MNSTVPPNTFCTGCGYSLAGLREDGKCPECAMSVAESVRHLAQARDIEKPLREIADGLLVVKIAYAVLLVDFVLMFVVVPFTNSMPDLGTVIWGFASLLLLCGAVAMVTGLVSVATPIQGARTPRRRLSHSTVLGIGLAGVMLGVLLFFPLWVVTPLLDVLGILLVGIGGSLALILGGMCMLAKRLSLLTKPTKLLAYSRKSSIVAIALCCVSTAIVGLAVLDTFGSSVEKFAEQAVAVSSALFVVAHVVLTFALSRTVRRIIGQLPPPTPPAAL